MRTLDESSHKQQPLTWIDRSICLNDTLTKAVNIVSIHRRQIEKSCRTNISKASAVASQVRLQAN